MKGKSIKIIAMILLVAMLAMCFSTVALATYSPSDFTGADSAATGNIKGAANKIVGLVKMVAVAVAVIMLVVLGIKYIAASPTEKADIKKGAIIYVVGAIFLFGAAGILQLVQTFSEDLTTVGSSIKPETSIVKYIG